jgi:hypothetical protein
MRSIRQIYQLSPQPGGPAEKFNIIKSGFGFPQFFKMNSVLFIALYQIRDVEMGKEKFIKTFPIGNSQSAYLESTGSAGVKML